MAEIHQDISAHGRWRAYTATQQRGDLNDA
jgi:hypothetical protein